jgi:uncharacterized protein
LSGGRELDRGGRAAGHRIDGRARAVRGGVRAARDYHAELPAESGIDWVFLSPPPGYGPLGPTERCGTYRTGGDTPVVDGDGHSAISGPDLALALVDELEAPRHHRQRFTVGY